MPKIPTSTDLVKHAASAANTSRQHLWQTIRPDQSLSWQTLLFLCLFSWLMALLTSDASLQPDAPTLGIGKVSLSSSPTKYALFTMGWIFLTLAIAWLLSKARWKIPLFELELRPAAWAAAAVACIFAFQAWHEDNFEPALTFWPILAAIFYLFPRCFSAKDGRKMPKASERQHLLIIVLISLLLSCWIRFSFLVGDWVEGYSSAFKPLLPGLEIDSGLEEGFTEEGTAGDGAGATAPISEPAAPAPPTPPARARPAEIAESIVASQLEAQPLPEIRQRLQTDPALAEALNARFSDALINAQQNPGWTLQISQVVPSPLSFQLQVTPPAAAQGDAQVTYKTCRVLPVENPGGAQLSRLVCSAAAPQ